MPAGSAAGSPEAVASWKIASHRTRVCGDRRFRESYRNRLRHCRYWPQSLRVAPLSWASACSSRRPRSMNAEFLDRPIPVAATRFHASQVSENPILAQDTQFPRGGVRLEPRYRSQPPPGVPGVFAHTVRRFGFSPLTYTKGPLTYTKILPVLLLCQVLSCSIQSSSIRRHLRTMLQTMSLAASPDGRSMGFPLPRKFLRRELLPPGGSAPTGGMRGHDGPPKRAISLPWQLRNTPPTAH